jgi:hypothetical protein
MSCGLAVVGPGAGFGLFFGEGDPAVELLVGLEESGSMAGVSR